MVVELELDDGGTVESDISPRSLRIARDTGGHEATAPVARRGTCRLPRLTTATAAPTNWVR